MKIMFEVEIDESKPSGKSSAGNPKWVASTEIEVNGKQYMVYLDIYQKSKQPKPENKTAVKVKAA